MRAGQADKGDLRVRRSPGSRSHVDCNETRFQDAPAQERVRPVTRGMLGCAGSTESKEASRMSTASHESHARGRTDVPLIEQTIGDFFDDMAARQPDALALVSRHEAARFTYLQLHAAASRLASALLRAGLAPGERIGIWSHNNVAWVLMQIATAKAGLVLVNINPAYRTAEVEYALNKVGCKALVTMPRFKTSEYLAMLRELGAARLPDLEAIWWIDRPGDADEAALDIPLARFSDLLATGEAGDPRVAEVQKTLAATDPINIQFTSGTTGFPKGATLTHRNILNNGFFIGECMKLT